MRTFEWNSNFVTDLPSVDEQHHRLVELINALGERLDGDNVSDRDLEDLFRQLVEYASYHFAEEEALMRETGLDERHVEAHIAKHRSFIEELKLLKHNARSDVDNIATEVLDYLIHWLTYHFLGQDQNMARQIRAMNQGQDATAAFEAGERHEDHALEPLLDAVNGLLARLSAQNRKLEELNETLERRVDERTRALAEANQRLRILSLTDALTGLPNRRHAIERLEGFREQPGPRDRPLAALMIDADHFKEINDRYGHEAGDAVLVELARTLDGAVRTDDQVFRLGGDEFLVLCPATDLDGGLLIAEQLRRRVAALRIPAGDGCWRGSVSIGLAVCDPATVSRESLLKAADEALYEAKAAGRGCVRSSIANHAGTALAASE